jgi:asparagine synthase (glutamine-hydrolysing)
MCGIAGILGYDGRPVFADELSAMCDVLAHRGPDDEGFHLGQGIGLAMRRLSIIDLKTGGQPVRNEDGSILAVLNGEIYNFRTLRRELERGGHAFRSASDSECIVHLYEELGPRCVDRMRGMFAFALWDGRRRMLLLARDRLGIKPLYYAEVGGRLLFASELKAILQIPEIERSLSFSALNRVFTAMCTPCAESIVAGVRKLEPGCLLTATAGRGARVERYWEPRFRRPAAGSEDDLVEELRARLDESVRLHLVSDVPVGAFLSGGIDSSAVVGTMARIAGGRLKTFSIGFAEQEFSELSAARQVARRFGTDHHELVFEPGGVDFLEDLAWHLDEPFGDSSALPTYLVSRLAARHVKVVLSGDGGDELFAGYDKYLVEARERRLARLARPIRGILRAAAGALPDGARGRNLLYHYSLAGSDRYLDASTLFRSRDREQLFRPEARERMAQHDPWAGAREVLERPGAAWLSGLQELDLRSYLHLDILTKVDRTSMAHGLEVRVPLLDHELVEFAAALPPELLLRGATTKYLMKRAVRGLLPDAIIDRRKQGFAVPLGAWFRGPLAELVRDLLLSQTARRRGLFDPAYVETLLRRHDDGRDLALQLWTLVSFELWCRVFLDRPPRAPQARRDRRAGRPPAARPSGAAQAAGAPAAGI